MRNLQINCKRKTDKNACTQLGFGASGAVTRPKVCANLQVMRPSERQWKPRLRQALARCVQVGEKRSNVKKL